MSAARTRTAIGGGIALLLLLGVAAFGWHAWHLDPMAQARLLMRRGDLHAAELVLRGVVRARPHDADALLRLGVVQLRLGDPIAAEHALREASASGADPHAVRPLLARALVGQGRGAEVLAQDGDTRGLSPAQASDLDIARSMAELQLGHADAARREAKAAQAADPHSADAALDEARIAQATGDPEAALAAARRALAIDPRLGDALMLVAGLRLQANDRPGAIAAYGAVVASPEASEVDLVQARLVRADLLLASGRTAEARADVDAVLRAVPRSPAGNLLAAILDARAGSWPAADQALELAGPLDRLPRANLLLALVKSHVGQPAVALDAAERFHARHDDDRLGTLVLASLDLAQNRPAAAVALLAPVASAGRAGPDALEILGDAYARQGDHDRAEAARRQAAAVGGRADAPVTLDRIGGAVLAQDPFDGVAGPDRHGPGDAAADPSAERRIQESLVIAELRAGHPDRAAEALARAAALHPEPWRIDTLTGFVRLGQLDVEGARRAFEAAYKARPDEDDAVLGLSRVRRLQGDPAAAVALLARGLSERPGDPALLSALVAIPASDPPDVRRAALDAVAAARAKRPGDVKLTVALASLELRAGDPERALSLAGSLDPNLVQALAVRADAERRLGHADAAAALYATLAQRDPTLRDQVLATLFAMHQNDAAGRLIDRGLAAAPNDPTLQAAAIRLAAGRGGLDAGVARAEAFVTPTADPATRLLAAQFLLASGATARAAAAFAKAGASMPPGVPDAVRIAAIRGEAAALLQQGDPSSGRALLRKGLDTYPGDPSLEAMLADLRLSDHDPSAARPLFEAVLKKHPDNVEARNNLAWIEQQQGDLDAARRDASLAYQQAPMPQTADTLGWILLAQGHDAAALALLRQAAAGGGSDPSIRFHFASALARSGDPARAAATLKPLVESGVAFPERAQAEALLKTLPQ